MSKKKKGTVTSESVPPVVIPEDEDVKPEEEQIPPDTRTVTITLEAYENIVGLFSTADIRTTCKYQDSDLGETKNIPITDGEDLPINESFFFQMNANSMEQTDQLISSPALLTILQQPGMCDLGLYEQLKVSEDLKAMSSVKSFESVVSIYEAFTGETVERGPLVKREKKVKTKGAKPEKKKRETKGKEKGSRGSKISKSSSASKKVPKEKPSISSVPKEVEPVVFGMCAIDFLPLFYGKKSFSETLTINPVEKLNDDKMSTYKNRPKIVVTVTIDKEFELKDAVFMNVTVESIYNLPSVMQSDMDYKICAMLPMEDSPKEPMVFSHPIFTTKTEEDVMKCWPGLRRIGVNANTTKYKIDSEDEIKNTVGCEINNYVTESESPRIEFNTIKRNLLLKEGTNELSFHIQKYRKIVLEIFMTTASKERTSISLLPNAVKDKGKIQHDKSDSVKSSSKGRSLESAQKGKSTPYLHLMTILDVSSLLFPGASKLRIASPLTTYNADEAAKFAGLTDSYFMPKPKQVAAETDVKESVPKKEKKGKDKSAKGSSKGNKDMGDLKGRLPPKPEAPPPPETSTPIFTEDGKPTFIIVEIELSQPINERRTIEDLKDELLEMLKDRPIHIPKIILTSCLTKDHYKEALNEITRDIYDKYCEFMKTDDSQKEEVFITYLKNIGAYETYLRSITKASTLLVTNKFDIEECADKHSKTYQNFIGEIFVYLVSVMNETLNKLIGSGLKPVVSKKPLPVEQIFFFGKEALQLGKPALADRYFLERLCNDEECKADYWFDYAIYNLEIKAPDLAYECVQEALSQKNTHKYSLMVFGVLLADKGQKEDAETCFLNLMVQQARWLEGWGVLYLFYQKITNFEGMHMALDMAQKYMDDERITTDYFAEFDDLAWTYKICPKTIFFRTAILLLKMRLYNWVEMALAEEIQKHYGIANYLLSAVCLYQGLYDHALEHIQEAKGHYGSDYAVSSLAGHCLLALNKQEEAKEEYLHVIESFNRPDDVHMVYINCAQILENLGNDQEARKLILLACKFSPTPYTWFRAGQLYLEENDLLSSEECFSEANFKDNRNPDTWGYLAIINLKLNRTGEAELCYCQALKNKLENTKLLEAIQQQLKKIAS